MSKRLICTNKICRWMTTEEESEDRVFNTGNCAKCNSPLEPYTTPTSNTSDELLKQIETKLRDYRFFGLVDEDGNDIEARLGDICEPEDLAKDISNIIEAHCNKARKAQLDSLIEEEIKLYDTFGDDNRLCVGIKIMADAVREQYDVIQQN